MNNSLLPTAYHAVATTGLLDEMPNATDAVVAVYANHSAAEAAIHELQGSGFDMRQLSIVGKEYHSEEHAVGYYNAGDRMKYWGKQGAFWGGLWGFMFGAAFFAIPGLGPILVAGPLVAWIVGALEGAVVVGGLGVLGAGLYSTGIPKNSIVEYETAIKADKFLVIAHGTPEEVTHAAKVLHGTDSQHVVRHSPAALPVR